MNWIWIVACTATAQYAISELFSLFDIVARRLVRRSCRFLPQESQDRYAEEWAAELEAIPGAGLWRLLFALRVRLGACATARELGAVSTRLPVNSWLMRAGFVVAVSLLAMLLAPLTITLTFLVAAKYGRPIFRSRVVRARDGREVRLYSFNAPASSLVGRFLDSTDLDALPSLLPLTRGRIWPTAAELRVVAADVLNGRPTRPCDNAG